MKICLECCNQINCSVMINTLYGGMDTLILSTVHSYCIINTLSFRKKWNSPWLLRNLVKRETYFKLAVVLECRSLSWRGEILVLKRIVRVGKVLAPIINQVRLTWACYSPHLFHYSRFKCFPFIIYYLFLNKSLFLCNNQVPLSLRSN